MFLIILTSNNFSFIKTIFQQYKNVFSKNKLGSIGIESLYMLIHRPELEMMINGMGV